MKRIAQTPRQGWRDTIQKQGLVYQDTVLPDGTKTDYWNETAAYELSQAEVEKLEAAAAELFEMCIAAGDHVINKHLWHKLHIPKEAISEIIRTWNDDTTPSVYARYDFCYNDKGEIKLFEFNADTPTSLLESAVIQWYWQQDVHPSKDQWNGIHERLIEAWKRRINEGHLDGKDTLYLAYSAAETSGEDYFTTVYMQETAHQAGLKTEVLPIEHIGFDPHRGFFTPDSKPINTVFKLYPWEWMMQDQYGIPAVEQAKLGAIKWVEPIYKMLWSNKAILPILWELFPKHPLLLESYFDTPNDMQSYAKKPLLGREGQGVVLVEHGKSLETSDAQMEGPVIYQQLAALPDYDGNHPMMGVWMVDGEPAGLGIREATGLITNNTSRFVPHFIA